MYEENKLYFIKEGILKSFSNIITVFVSLILPSHGLCKCMDEKTAKSICQTDRQMCFAKISILFSIFRSKKSNSEVEKGSKLLKFPSFFEAAILLN